MGLGMDILGRKLVILLRIEVCMSCRNFGFQSFVDTVIIGVNLVPLRVPVS